MPETVDAIIVGGGPVGSALALALRNSGLQAVLLEARQAGNGDARPLALSYGSRLILERLGVWETLADTATPIRNIHVSQRGGFGRVGLSAAEAGFPELGYVVDYGRVARTLAQAVATTPVRCLTGAKVSAWQGGDPAHVDYEYAGEQHALTAPLIVIADGGVADTEAGAASIDYRQSAVTSRVVSERPHNNMAYERFTSQGPLALLPDGNNEGNAWALVWTTTPDRARQLCAMEPAAFLAALRAEFGGRAGNFTAVSGRAAYPLRRRLAPQPADHAVLIGNAAQTLHPVAGQGFNLGLRDAWELAELMISRPSTLGSREWLNAYETRRSKDRRGGIGFTHALVQLFSNDLMPLRMVRGTGLALLGCVPPLKNFLVRRMTFGARG